MGLILNNLPSITENGGIVTIDTDNTIILTAPLLNFYDSVGTYFLGNNVNIASNTVNIGNNTLIFFDPANVKTPITQPGPIPDATPATAHDRVNDILTVLRDFNLIAT